MPTRGEVWMVDLGMVAKTRPCLLLNDEPPEEELALLVVIPHTTSTRGSDWEVALPKSYLKPGAFHLQQITSVPLGRLEYRMGKLDEAEFAQIRRKLRSILAL